MKAYSIHRPISLGTYPKDYEIIEIVNFDTFHYVEQIGRGAYGYIHYSEDVPADVLARFELMVERVRDPHFEPAVRCISKLLGAGDEDKALEKLELAVSKYGLDRDELYQAVEQALS